MYSWVQCSSYGVISSSSFNGDNMTQVIGIQHGVTASMPLNSFN